MKLQPIILFLALTIIKLITNSKVSNDTEPQKRIAVFTSFVGRGKHIIYNPPFERFNNVTGTGNKFRDNAYNAICMSLNCETGCCSGDTNVMACGGLDECNAYIGYVRAWMIAGITIGSIILALNVISMILRCSRKQSFCEAMKFTLLVVAAIVFFPFFLVYLLTRRCQKGKTVTKHKAIVRYELLINSAPANLYRQEPDEQINNQAPVLVKPPSTEDPS
jgi:hypothetical protein